MTASGDLVAAETLRAVLNSKKGETFTGTIGVTGLDCVVVGFCR